MREQSRFCNKIGGAWELQDSVSQSVEQCTASQGQKLPFLFKYHAHLYMYYDSLVCLCIPGREGAQE